MRRRVFFFVFILIIGSSITVFQNDDEIRGEKSDERSQPISSYDVQANIDSTPEGGTLILPAGTFNGSFFINRSMTLTGMGDDLSILSTRSYYSLRIRASNVTVSNIGFRARDTCIYSIYGYDDIEIRNCNFSYSYRGIYISGSLYNDYKTRMKIHNNSFYSIFAIGCYFRNIDMSDIRDNHFSLTELSINTYSAYNSNITNNRVIGGSIGIQVYLGQYLKIESNSLIDQQTSMDIDRSAKLRISENYLERSIIGIDMWDLDDSEIFNNILKRHEDGIYLYRSERNVIHNNSMDDCSGSGIETYYSQYNTVENCTISNCGILPDGNFHGGIYLNYNSGYASIINNEMYRCGLVSIPVSTSWTTYEIRGNHVNSRDMIFLDGEQNVYLDNNIGQIILNDCSNITIKGQNLSRSNIGAAIFDSHDIHILDNVLNDNMMGIYHINDRDHYSITDITIIGNTIINTTSKGIQLSSNYWLKDILIERNHLEGGKTGIHLHGHSPITSLTYSTGIKMMNNSITYMDISGMNIHSISESWICNNTIIDCVNSINYWGSYRYDEYSVNISNNEIDGGELGINLTRTEDIFVLNNSIRNTTEICIQLNSGSYGNIHQNEMTPLGGSGMLFISGYSDHIDVRLNTIIGADLFGIHLMGGPEMEFHDNDLKDCGFFLQPDGPGDHANLKIYETNLVNGRPVKYEQGSSGTTVSGDYGQVILFECNNPKIEDQVISNTSIGIQLAHCDYYLIDNCTITDCYQGIHIQTSYLDFEQGKIKWTSISNCRIDGIHDYKSDLRMENCTVSNCGYPFYEEGRSGIYSSDCDTMYIDSRFIDCGVFIDLEFAPGAGYIRTHLSFNTTVNGKPLIIVKDMDNLIIHEPAGEVYLLDCDHVVIENQDLSGATFGIYSAFSSELTVRNTTAERCISGILLISADEMIENVLLVNCSLNNNHEDGIKLLTKGDYFIDGFHLMECELNENGGNGIYAHTMRNGFSIENSTIDDNALNGIDLQQYLGYGHHATISNNSILENGEDGIFLNSPTKVLISGNRVVSNGGNGIKFGGNSDHSSILWNDISYNKESGIRHKKNGNNMEITNNTLNHNGVNGCYIIGNYNLLSHNDMIFNKGHGLVIESNLCEIKWNNISQNLQDGLYIVGSNHRVTNNSFYRNMRFAIEVPRNVIIRENVDNYFIENGGYLGQVMDLSGNYWDNRERGNFYSDHQSPDNDCDLIVDTPYFIYGPIHYDRYPQVIVNYPPEILNDPSTNAISHVEYLQRFEFYDRNPIDRLRILIHEAPEFLVWNDVQNALIGTPLTEHIGSHTINLSVDDNKGGFVYLEYTLVVANNPVKLLDLPIPDMDEEEYFEHKIPDLNLDNDPLEWSIETTASFLHIDVSSGILTGTPDDEDIGKHWARIMVNDGRGAYDEVNYTFRVLNVNDVPKIITEDVKVAYEDEYYWVDYEYNDPDPDGDEVEWYLDTDAGFLKMNDITGSLYGRPVESDIGVYQVNITLVDIHGSQNFRDFILEVLNVNDAPVIISDEPLDYVLQDEDYHHTFSAIDTDPTDDVLIWSMETNATFLEMDPEFGLLSGTPDNDDVGEWDVGIKVEDGNGGYDVYNFTLIVIEVNDPPVIITTSLPDAYDGQLYNVLIEANDPDHPPDDITFGIEGAPSFLSIDPGTGELSGLPEQKDVGSYTFDILVRDDLGLITPGKFNLNVINVNDAPQVIDDVLDIRIMEDSGDNYFAMYDYFYDIDGDHLIFENEINDGHLSIIFLENGSMVITPVSDWNGRFIFNVTGSDGELDVSIEVTITVSYENDAPFNLKLYSKDRFSYDEEQSLSASADDRDLIYGDELTFLWFEGNSKEIAVGKDVILDLPPGKHSMTLMVVDLYGENVEKEFTLTVEDEESGFPYLILIIIVVVILLVILIPVFVFLILRNKKKQKERKQEDDFFLPKQPGITLDPVPEQSIDIKVKRNDIPKECQDLNVSKNKSVPIKTNFDE